MRALPCLCAWVAAAVTAVAAPKPNVIFIMADDLGYADLGCYGQKVIHTPALDRMAAEGTRFTHCYTGSPVCAPSRSVLMTGQHTGHTTVRGNYGKGGVRGWGGVDGRVPIKADDVTIAEVMRDAGYVTGMFGKWGLGEPGTEGVPWKQGWDEFYGFLNQRRAHHYYPDWLWRNERKEPLEGNQDGGRGEYAHDLFAREAMSFIRRHANKRPFLLYVPFCVPHDKYQIPDLGAYADEPWKQDEKVYAAMITRMDNHLGQMFDLLRELGIDDHTVVFFTSDNGAAKRWKGRFDSCGPLRGKKRDLTEGGIRVPMIVRWPGVVAADSVNHAPWWLADVLPTCAAIAGAEAPDGVDGINLLPMLTGSEESKPGRSFYWEFYEGGFVQAGRIGRWKGIRRNAKPLELYDLIKDPGEANDLAGAMPDKVAEFEALFVASRVNSPHWPSPVDR